MSGPADGDFFEHFIEDFFAECEEHLTTARRVLLELEGGSGRSSADTLLVQELHRTLHTLKGLSGMVGLASAEQLAHALEDGLRAAHAAAAPFDASLVDTLLAGVDLLERCVATRRTGGEAPDTRVMLTTLSALARRADEAAPAARASGELPAAGDTDTQGTVYHFEFTPSRALSDRGVGVESVRTRLAALGTVLDAKPRITEGGVMFDFWVEIAPGSVPDDAWAPDGLTWTYDTPTAAPADASADAPVATSRPAGAAGASVVRVDLARLDGVMRLVGDLVVSRSRLDEMLRLAAGGSTAVWDALEETNTLMERQLRRLRQGIMRIRLVPVGEVFERLRFAVRDAARESGKQVTLELHGQQTEIDKLVVDRMLEPLLHLVRNAVSHGIEGSEDRLAAGKPAEGTITLRAAAAGDRILVQVEDDGLGIDMEAVEARARTHGLLGAGEHLTPDGLIDVLCASGFSTRDGADLTSGRGVGMDVVRSTVRALAGSISLDSTLGRGTRFSIELPLTLMIVDALLVEIGGQTMAVPQPVLREVLQVEASSIVQFENNDVVSYRGGVLPLLHLARLFALPAEPRSQYYLLVVGTDHAPVGLLVDRLLGLREIVVHPVVDPLVALPGVGGATELGDGRVALILDAAAIVRLAHVQRPRVAASRDEEPAVSLATT